MLVNTEQKTFVNGMTKACLIAADSLKFIKPYVIAGAKLSDLDTLLEQFIIDRGAISACRGYHGYPKATCISVNEVACHGVPNDYILKTNDFLNIDVTVNCNGYFGDTSQMYSVGLTTPEQINILFATNKALNAGIEQCLPLNNVGDIGFAIGKSITKLGYYTTKDLGGHGIGTVFHGEPWIPFHGKKGRGAIIQPWTCITIEPILLTVNKEIIQLPIPGSTITKIMAPDNCLNAQLEHTVLITDTGYEVLTL